MFKKILSFNQFNDKKSKLKGTSLNETLKDAKQVFVKYKQGEEEQKASLRRDRGLVEPEIPVEPGIEPGVEPVNQPPAAPINYLEDARMQSLWKAIEANKIWGPNILAIPLTKLYLKVYKEDRNSSILKRLLEIITGVSSNQAIIIRKGLSDPLLKNYLVDRIVEGVKFNMIDELNKIIQSELADSVEALNDCLDRWYSEMSALWFLKSLRADAAMGPERNLPPFNQKVAFQALAEDNLMRQEFISVASDFWENAKSDKAFEAEIVTIKKKMATYGNLNDLLKFLKKSFVAAGGPVVGMNDFLNGVQATRGLSKIVYKSAEKLVLVVFHEMTLAKLFPMTSWCILPNGMGKMGRGLWSNYVGSKHNAIQFAMVDFSKDESDTMKYIAFSYKINQDTITFAHKKDDGSLSKLVGNNLVSILTSLLVDESAGDELDDRLTGRKELEEALMTTLSKERIGEYYEETVKYENSVKIGRDNFKSKILSESSPIRQMVKACLVNREAGRKLFMTPEMQSELGIISLLISADPEQEIEKWKDYKKSKNTIVDLYLKIFEPTEKVKTMINSKELAEFTVDIVDDSTDFSEEGKNEKKRFKFDERNQVLTSLLNKLEDSKKQMSVLSPLQKNPALAKILEGTIEGYQEAIDVISERISNPNKNINTVEEVPPVVESLYTYIKPSPNLKYIKKIYLS